MIQFFVECTPPTITSQQRRHNYKQAKLKQAEAFWKAVMEINAPNKPLKGVLRLDVSVTYPHTNKSCKVAEKLSLYAIAKITTPDCDNINKLIQDAMAKCGYFENDSRIYHLEVTKWHGDIPGVAVKLERDEYWTKILNMKE